MPTNTDKIDDLSHRVATITERLENVRKETAGLAELAKQVAVHSERLDVIQHATEALIDLTNMYAVLEQQIKDLKEKTDDASRRQWSIWQLVIGAVIGGAITLVVQILVKKLLP